MTSLKKKLGQENIIIENKKLDHLKQFELVRIKTSHNKAFFAQHRHNFYELVLITEGNGKFAIDFKEYPLEKDLIYIIKPSQVHNWIIKEFKNEYDGYIFLFSRDLFENDVLVNELFELAQDPCIKVSNETKTNLISLIKMIEEEYGKDDLLLISHLFSATLKYILKSKKENDIKVNLDKRIYLLKKLIHENYKNEKSASFYAKQLDLTTKRLNEITQKNMNQTVSQIINDKILIEAKRELVFSSLTIKEISEYLGYFDASYFSRFFKKHTTYSPQEFREKKLK